MGIFSELIQEQNQQNLGSTEKRRPPKRAREYKSRIDSYAKRQAPGHTLQFVDKDMVTVS